MSYDVAAVRAQFPALTEGAAHFDGPGGSQVPLPVAQAVAQTLVSAIANRGTVTRAERRADAVVADARQAAADLVGGVPDGIVFGRSATALTYDVANMLADRWMPGDEIVVTRLDHDANIRPWVQAAEAVDAVIRWVDFDKQTGELSVDAVADQLSRRTRVIAVTGASNLVGTRPDLPGIADMAGVFGALVYVDGVHLTPHAPVDLEELGADFYVCSPYKFLGPHLGVLAADPALLEQLHPDKLLPSPDVVPERFELGTLPYELLAGTTAAIDFIAGLDTGAQGSRRERVLASMRAVEEHEATLFAALEEGLGRMRGVRQIAAGAKRRTPTTLFTVDGLSPKDVHQRLATYGVNAPAGSFYAIEASRFLGLGDVGGVRVGLAPYTNREDVERLLVALREIAATA